MRRIRKGWGGCLAVTLGFCAVQVAAWGQQPPSEACDSSSAIPVEVRIFLWSPPEQPDLMPAALAKLVSQLDPSQVQVLGGEDVKSSADAGPTGATTDATVCLRVPEDHFAELVRGITEQPPTSNSILMAPTLLLNSGAEGTITDGATRPFITSFRRVVGDFSIAYQPVVKTFFEGTRITIGVTQLADETWKVSAKYEVSRIHRVDTLDLSGKTAARSAKVDMEKYTSVPAQDQDESQPGEVSIQVPQIHTRSRDVVSSLEADETLLVAIGEWQLPRRIEKGLPIPGGDRLFKRVVVQDETVWLAMAITPRPRTNPLPANGP